MRRAVFARMSVVALSMMVALGACASKTMPLPQGRSMVMATYSAGELVTTLPEAARVGAVIAAADQTFAARAYSVQRREVTEESGKIIALPPRSSGFPRVIVTAQRVANGTRVVVEHSPWGEEAVCRSTLDGILERLGL
jgi:hypothetical protein